MKSNLFLKAKDFATEITIHNARTHQMQSEGRISNEHVTNNKAVRETLVSRGSQTEPAGDLCGVTYLSHTEANFSK